MNKTLQNSKYGSSLDHSTAKATDGQSAVVERDDSWKTGFNSASSLSNTRKFVIGIVIVIVIAITWVGSTQTAKSTYSGGFAPFFLVWFGTSWMMVVFPLTAPLFFVLGPGTLTVEGLRELWRYIASLSVIIGQWSIYQ